MAGKIPKAILCWSGGKDSAYCLYTVLKEKTYEVCYLLTTINAGFKRVSMHGVREALLEQQVAALGIPLLKVYVSEGSNDEYEKQMEKTLLQAKSEGIEHVLFGDIFLEDLRIYRENNLAKVGMKATFPLWKKNTAQLAADFLMDGFKTITCCVNDGYLGEEWVGKELDEQFLKVLPEDVDPCGENGEYHTFCHEGPIFKKKIIFHKGEKVYKALEIKTNDNCGTEEPKTKGFWFCDLL